MALVCDVKSNDNPQQQEPSALTREDTAMGLGKDDLEDGEIEDDDEDEEEAATGASVEPPAPQDPPVSIPQSPSSNTTSSPSPKFAPNNDNNKFGHNARNNRQSVFERPEKHPPRYEEGRKRTHLTEAEKSVMHLHKLERIERQEREKRERYKREQATVVDDFASNIEKAIASVLKKDKKNSDEEKDEEDGKRGRKRKRKDKDKKRTKQRRGASPKSDQFDDNIEVPMNTSPDGVKGGITTRDRSRSTSSRSDYESYTSSTSSDHSRDSRKKKDRGRKDSRSKNKDRTRGGDRKYNKDKTRDQKNDPQMKDGLCLFYLQGKCNKGEDCPYSHEAPVPMKLELCKFYMMDCCAKGEKCSYMHSEFPCKFYHTGLPCYTGDSCKFAHGGPLEERHKQILFKHIETAPKEILGDFPRLNRDGALAMINQAQKLLEIKYGTDKKKEATPESMIKSAAGAGGVGIPPLLELNIPVPMELLPKDETKEKTAEKPTTTTRERSRPSRWQDADASEPTLNLQHHHDKQLQSFGGLKGFYSERGDQDMRVNSNGDIDMRTLPPQLSTLLHNVEPATKHDVDIRNRLQDVDIRHLSLNPNNRDVDIRQIVPPPLLPCPPPSVDHHDNVEEENDDEEEEEPNLQIVTATDDERDAEKHDLPANLPKKQRELFLRIQAQQKENVPEHQRESTGSDDEGNIDWYSDDDDDLRLTIRDDLDEPREDTEHVNAPEVAPQAIKPVEVMEKLGDLSKIDISAEVTALLSSINASASSSSSSAPRDPRTQPGAVPGDPRRGARLGSTETRKPPPEKLSIYEQGSISMENAVKDVDLRINPDKDMDLRPSFGDTDLRPGSGRSDIDLRHLGLPFKAIQNYTPASEIDASISSHPAIAWHVRPVEIPRPDYAGLKLNVHDAQSTGDPRLRKIFRLSTEEKDSPASPKDSPKAPAATTGIRADPRRRKIEEKTAESVMSYSQQLNVLQTSAFYQSLTSNQKVMLNQEVASRSDHTGGNDPTLNGILSNLGLLLSSSSTSVPPPPSIANANALSILANVNSMNQAVNANLNVPPPPFVNQQVQPGLLGAAPGVPNLPHDFQLNFDPRQGGLLGNAPFNPNYNEDYYNDGGNSGGGGPVGRGGRGTGGRGGFRDRQQQRRGARNFNNNNNNRNNGARNFRNRNRNHNNRSRTPP